MGCQWQVATVAAAIVVAEAQQCPGSISMPGYTGGDVYIVPTGWGDPTAALTEVLPGGELRSHMEARAYFASSCTAGTYDNTEYLALNLLGKTLQYTTDLSGAGCGCNAALYLVSMQQNSDPSTCGDFYCDANSVCGVSCAEIDIQEGNQLSWHSTLHSAIDRAGVGGGYGGGAGWNGPRDWGHQDFRPGSPCIDTSRPFQVAASFPVDGQGNLVGMEVVLSQTGRDCTLAATGLNSYNGMDELSSALQAGMTPVFSYWSSEDMLWMDGKGTDQQGPCSIEDPSACADSVSFSDFSITDYVPGEGPAPAPGPVPVPVPIPMPPGFEGQHAKLAIYKALSLMCGGEAQVVANTLLEYAGNSFAWLESSEYQGCISIVVALAGLAAAYDGPAFYRVLFLMLVAACSVCIAKYEIESHDIRLTAFYKFLTLCQVALVMPLATFNGFEGSQILFGAFSGVVGAFGSGGWTRALSAKLPGLDCFWYSCGALVGCLVFTIWRQMTMRVLGPLFGGFLVASGVSACVSHVLSGASAGSESHLPFLPAPSATWPAAASELLGAAAARGALMGGCAAAIIALLVKGYGSSNPDWQTRKVGLSIAILLAYIVAMAIIAVVSRGPAVEWPWPLFGCSIWALVVLASVHRQLMSIEDEDIRHNFESTNNLMPDALRSLRRLRTRALAEIGDERSPTR